MTRLSASREKNWALLIPDKCLEEKMQYDFCKLSFRNIGCKLTRHEDHEAL